MKINYSEIVIGIARKKTVKVQFLIHYERTKAAVLTVKTRISMPKNILRRAAVQI